METEPEVLLVGAGPAGLATGLLLAEQGVCPTIIDAASGTTTHSYACALHPYSLSLLSRFGLMRELLEWGNRIDTVAFYDGWARKAELKLSNLDLEFPYLLVLPQSALEWILESALKRIEGIQVNWRRQLLDVQATDRGVVATIEELAAQHGPEGFKDADTAVKRALDVRTPLLVGADGRGSLVRQRLGIDYELMSDPETFLVFEFQGNAGFDGEVRVVLDEATSNVLWPISSTRSRWTFQIPAENKCEPSYDKSREPHRAEDEQTSNPLCDQFWGLVQERAPWFAGEIEKFSWATQVKFERRLSKQFSKGRCWLLGDAAHQTSPVGVQSFNVGLREAEEFVKVLKDSYDGIEQPEVAKAYDRRWREQWKQLFGSSGWPKMYGDIDDWVKRRAARLVSCCPASGNDLVQLLKQVELALP